MSLARAALSYQLARDRISSSTAALVGAVYFGLGDGDWMAASQEQVTPILVAGSRVMSDLTSHYTGSMLRSVAETSTVFTPMLTSWRMTPTGQLLAAVPGSQVGPAYGWRGWTVQVDGMTVESPVLRLRRLLAEGVAEDVARQMVRAYAEGLTDNQLRAVESATRQNTVGVGGSYLRKPLRWVRVIEPGACGWCRVVADREYSDEAALHSPGWHTHCRCGWSLSTAETLDLVRPGSIGRDWRDVIKEPAQVEDET